MNIQERIDAAANYIRTRTDAAPAMGLVLGSGLGSFAQTLDDCLELQFSEIPGFPKPTVEGHAGTMAFGRHKGRLVLALNGRVHYYEGLSQQEITIPIRVMKRLGVETVMLTNAAGGVNLGFQAGALMMIADHINYSGQNPLIGRNLDEFGPRFPDMSDIYTKQIRGQLKEKAADAGILLDEGVYAMYSGPSYETPAEIRMFRAMGADAVGMSTVPEAIVARHSGMKVIGVSCITNMAAGVLDQPLAHAEVVETAARVKDQFMKVVSIAVEICG